MFVALHWNSHATTRVSWLLISYCISKWALFLLHVHVAGHNNYTRFHNFYPHFTHYNVHDYWQGQQSHPEPDNLIYADVTIATKHKKRKKPRAQTLAAPHRDETHDLDVQYSTLNHDLMVCNDKQEAIQENIYYNSKIHVYASAITIVIILAVLHVKYTIFMKLICIILTLCSY